MRYADNCSPRRAEPYPPSEISPHIHSAGSVAVLVNLETTPVQLHATLFPSGDPAGRGISSYLPRPHRCASEGFAEVVGYGVGGGEGSLSGADRDCAVAAPGTDEFLDAPAWLVLDPVADRQSGEHDAQVARYSS